MAICWSPRLTPSLFELYIFINVGCVEFFFYHRPSDLSPLSTWLISKPSGLVDSRWTGFLSFHVQQIKLSLWRKREYPLLSLFTCSLLWTTMSLGRHSLLLLTVSQLRVPLHSNSLSKTGKLIQRRKNNLKSRCKYLQNIAKIIEQTVL